MNRVPAAARSAWQAMNEPAVRVIPPMEEAETLLSQVKRRDWHDIITTILVGMPKVELARRVGVKNWNTVTHWMTDPRAEPKDSHARMLMVLYRRAKSG